MATETAERIVTIPQEDISLVELVAMHLDLGDAGNHNISIRFPFIGNSYLIGWRASDFQPYTIGLINAAIIKYGNLDELMRQHKKHLENFPAQSYIPVIAAEFRRHPMIMGFLAGMEGGSGIYFDKQEIRYDDLKYPEGFQRDKFLKDNNRIIPIEKIDTAICSGAIFGQFSDEKIKGFAAGLKINMFNAQPRNFEAACNELFTDAYLGTQQVPEKSGYVDRIRSRKKTFADVMFAQMLNGGPHLIEHSYQR